MQVVLTILYVLTALLLIGVVLIQQPKSSTGLFSGAGQSLLGTGSKTFMTKFTTGLAAVFMLLCIALAILPQTGGSTSKVADLLNEQQKAADQAASQAEPQPAGGASSAGQEIPAGGRAPAPAEPAAK